MDSFEVLLEARRSRRGDEALLDAYLEMVCASRSRRGDAALLGAYLEMVCASARDQRAFLDWACHHCTLDRHGAPKCTPDAQCHLLIVGPPKSGKRTTVLMLEKIANFITKAADSLYSADEEMCIWGGTTAPGGTPRIPVVSRLWSGVPLRNSQRILTQPVTIVALRDAEVDEAKRATIFDMVRLSFVRNDDGARLARAVRRRRAQLLWGDLRAHWRARWIALYWFELTASQMAPGGRAAERDRAAFEAEGFCGVTG